MDLWPIFLAGLTVGGLSCMAVQGGLLAATIAQREQEKLQERDSKAHTILATTIFLVAKIVSYTILGFLLGYLGSTFTWSPLATIVLQFAVAVFMLGTALNILQVHPIFRYFVIQPPHFLTRHIRKQSKSDAFFTPAILGAFTVFIPCGTTQAMMALAIGSTNPWTGAAIMFAFTLGTAPVFFLLGFLTAKLGDVFKQGFMRFAAVVILLLALFNADNALALTGSNYTLQNGAKTVFCVISYCDDIGLESPVENATITIADSGYFPQTLTVKAGSIVTLHLKNESGGGCTQAFTIPSIGAQAIVPVGKEGELNFRAPKEPGQIAFMCSMGMYRGVINII